MKHEALAVALPLALLLILGHSTGAWAKSTELVQVNDDNWNQILEGEWMVEFFAPWCPACRSLQPVWEEFSSWSKDLGIQVGQVDITSSPGLSGRFMITALPTIFHVKEGTFRQYKGSRTKDEFMGFVEEKRWEVLEPVSSWQSPSSIQMTVVSQFYKISMGLRNVMNVLLEEYGIPSWAAYLIFGAATILIGLVLGLVLVCVIDCIYPPGGHKSSSSAAGESREEVKEKDSDDEFTEEIQDEEESQAENDDTELKEQEGSSVDATSQSRRRKARKD